MDKKENDLVEIKGHLEPSGIQRYEHDIYNLTDKEKARQILDQLMKDYTKKGGKVTKGDPA